jgi:pimeloyl-ACP methyl ester carboxylesterase
VIPVDYVFVHGGGQGGWVWDETIAALAQQTEGRFGRALALDVPGCGAKRGRDTAHLTMDDITTELALDVERAGFRDVVLVGHSQAGTVLPGLLERKPGLFRRAVYVTCSLPLPGQSITQMMGSSVQGEVEDEVGWPADPKDGDPQGVFPLMFCNDMDQAQAAAFLARLGADAWPAQSYQASDWSFDRLGETPASFIVCLRDAALPARWQEVFAQRLKAERLVRIDAGHQVMNTRPHALAEALRCEASVLTG